ncbi:hypothetical protein GLOIN_2v1790609 [Rhizophagus irregularis DAOM 181602=DAOM 197198]|nr:hypothetical protein GLOIN_2v1790609 [Rhizophagus irregularis DAOM 181602=DAOM 197198]
MLRTLAFSFTKHRLIIPNVLPSTVPILSTLDSLDVNSSTQTQMGFAWIEITDATPNLGPPPPSYKGALSFNPSSTKAEVYALLTAIIAVPDDSELDTNIEMQQSFSVAFNRYFNYEKILDPDDLANAARQLAPYEINPTNLPGSLMTPIWASIAPIDRDIRKFCHNLTDAYTFDQFLGNPSLSPIFDRFPISSIHWPLTRSWLQYNSTPNVCSFTKSSHNAFKIKALNHILPCGDILTKHYPDLYSNNYIPCPVCNNYQDTNEHLGLCSNLLPVINNILLEHKQILQRLLVENTSYSSVLISQSVDQLELLSPISDSNSYNHPLYLIIHQLVSQDLYNLVRSFTFNDKLTRSIIWELLISFHEHIYQQIWPKHCSLLKLWEQRNGITSKRKHDFQRKKPKKPHDYQLNQTTARPRIASSSHHRSQNLYHPGPRTNSSSSDGTSCRLLHPWSSTAPSTHPLHLLHLLMWLILCTCNFLHSGGWLSSVRHPILSRLPVMPDCSIE